MLSPQTRRTALLLWDKYKELQRHHPRGGTRRRSKLVDEEKEGVRSVVGHRKENRPGHQEGSLLCSAAAQDPKQEFVASDDKVGPDARDVSLPGDSYVGYGQEGSGRQMATAKATGAEKNVVAFHRNGGIMKTLALTGPAT
eukprot:g17424.t1